MSLSVVVAGNPSEGYQVIGPFKQPQYAAEWADEWVPDTDWWVLPLKSEEEFQNGSTDAEHCCGI